MQALVSLDKIRKARLLRGRAFIFVWKPSCNRQISTSAFPSLYHFPG